jgi:hypothetical protein
VDVDELYRAPFGEFIAKRDALARSLRKEGQREEADEVKKLRKPALSAWALNQLPRDDVKGLLAAGAALRQARGGDALRDASHEERDAVEELASKAAERLRDAGHPVTDKTAGELRDTLHAAALDEEARDLLEHGRLVEPRQAIGLGGFEGAPAPAKEPKRAPAKKNAAPSKKDQAAEAKRRREEKAAARTALRDAEKSVRERERELRSAEDALDKAQRAADQARDAVDDAREEAERRQAELDALD